MVVVVVVVVQEHVSLLSSLENTASGTHVELFPRIIREPRIGKRSVGCARYGIERRNSRWSTTSLGEVDARGGPVEEKGRGGRDTAVL